MVEDDNRFPDFNGPAQKDAAHWFVGQEWPASEIADEEYFSGLAAQGLMNGDTRNLLAYLMSDLCSLPDFLRIIMVQCLSSNSPHLFHLTLVRGPNAPKGPIITPNEMGFRWQRDRFIAHDLVRHGMLERGRQAIAIAKVAEATGLAEETIKKIWKAARRLAVDSYRVVQWCQRQGIDVPVRGNIEDLDIDPAFKPDTPKDYIEGFIIDYAPDERKRAGVAEFMGIEEEHWGPRVE